MWHPVGGFPQAPNSFTHFAAQAWYELLGLQTPDTFYARVVDLPTLLNEVDAVAELSLDDDRWVSHLLMISDELHEARQTEASYLAGHPKLRASIDALVTSIRGKVDPRILRERVQIVLGLFGSGPARWC